MVPRKKLDIPEFVSDRLVTNRGVHLVPAGYHGDWLNRAQYWTELLVRMGVSWAVILNDGDSVRQTYNGLNPIKVLLDAGVIPIIREHNKFPRPFTDNETVLWSVDFYGQYGLKPLWIVRNEPFDFREWVTEQVPPNGWDIIMSTWAQAAQFIADRGGYVGFPDGPLYPFNPFESIKAYGVQHLFDEGKAFYTGHHYGKNRPRDYPYDAVTRFGVQLTDEAYRRLLDDYADDRAWWEEPIELINQRRTSGQNPTLTAIQDDTCWRGWEKIAYWSLQTFGYVVPMAMTEGGWVPRDRPGTGPNTDIRVPHDTPRMVAKRTLQMFDAPSPFFSICPWLLADDAMCLGGYVGWPFDSWVGWAYADKYGPEKPVVDMLKAQPPKETLGGHRAEPLVLDVETDTRDWAWVTQAYGAGYRRGSDKVLLLEVHEYEGPATLEAQVVDRDGLPVEGVEFYYYYPGAPDIPPTVPPAVDEWYPGGVAGATGPDGRLCFAAAEAPAAPGKSLGAIWPKGKGDVLDHVGLLAGTHNRHVNAVWLWQAEGTPDIPPPPGNGGPPPPKEGWEMTVEYRPGARIIAGCLPDPGINVAITDPWGNVSTVRSGSKPEWGPGGFEVLAPHLVEYTIAFLDQTFKVQMKDGATVVTLTQVEAPPVEPPPVEPPPVEPPPVEPPPVEPPPVEPPPVEPPPVEPPPEGDRWAQVTEKLARIAELIESLPKNTINTN